MPGRSTRSTGSNHFTVVCGPPKFDYAILAKELGIGSGGIRKTKDFGNIEIWKSVLRN